MGEKKGIRAISSRQYALFNAFAGLLTPLACVVSLTLAYPVAGAGETSIPVTLFGQPCVLKGPLDQKTLKAVHAISPEQIASPFSSSRTSEQTRRAISRLHDATGLPPGLDRYRDQLSAELSAQLAFLDGLEAARKAGNSAPLIAAAKPHLKTARQKEFESLAAKFPARGSSQTALIEQLFDLYGDALQTDAAPGSPSSSEEEFHRAIHHLNIQYLCNFDSGDDSATGTDGGDEDAPAPGKK